MRVVISAGGTGGHIYPALAIINKLKEKDKNLKLLYIGTTDRMEKDIIPNMGIEYEGIKVMGLSKNPIKLVNFGVCTLKAIKKCKDILNKFKPDIVIGVGGYVTVPVIYSAKKLGIKTILHEQNSIPGKANRFLAKYADTICVSMESSIKYFKNSNVIFTGNPRSEDAINANCADKLKYGLHKTKKLVVIFTGSLGASTVNDKIIEAIPKLNNKNYEIIFITGKEYYDDIKKVDHGSNIKILAYEDKMLELLRVTDLIVSRAGASTIAEITALGLPSILIPSPYVANNHQYINAKDLMDNNATILIEEKDLTSDVLVENIDKILNDEKLYKMLSTNVKKLGVANSSTRIYNEIEKLTNCR